MRSIRKGTAAVCMSAKATDGVGTEIDVAPYRHVMVAVFGAALAAGTLKCQGSLLMAGDTNLDFSAVVSVSNLWDYVAMYDMEDGALVPGDTGITLAPTEVRQFMVNTDGLRTLNFETSGMTGGSVTVRVFPISAV